VKSDKQREVDIVQVNDGYVGEAFPGGKGYPGTHFLARDFDDLVDKLRRLFKVEPGNG